MLLSRDIHYLFVVVMFKLSRIARGGESAVAAPEPVAAETALHIQPLLRIMAAPLAGRRLKALFSEHCFRIWFRSLLDWYEVG
jgi:hypothetical protein